MPILDPLRAALTAAVHRIQSSRSPASRRCACQTFPKKTSAVPDHEAVCRHRSGGRSPWGVYHHGSDLRETRAGLSAGNPGDGENFVYQDDKQITHSETIQVCSDDPMRGRRGSTILLAAFAKGDPFLYVRIEPVQDFIQLPQ
jgi:hypothetical protein